MEKCIDAAFTDALAANIADERACPVGDSVPHIRRDLRRCEDAANRHGFVNPATVADSGTQGWRGRKGGGYNEFHAGPPVDRCGLFQSCMVEMNILACPRWNAILSRA